MFNPIEFSPVWGGRASSGSMKAIRMIVFEQELIEGQRQPVMSIFGIAEIDLNNGIGIRAAAKRFAKMANIYSNPLFSLPHGIVISPRVTSTVTLIEKIIEHYAFGNENAARLAFEKDLKDRMERGAELAQKHYAALKQTAIDAGADPDRFFQGLSHMYQEETR